jgi:lipopolysaccharide exporter
MEIRARTFSGIFWSTFSSVGATLIQLAQFAILGRILTAEDFGLIAMAMVVLGVANVYADIGISNAILTHHEISTRQLSSLYWLNWGASIIAAAAVWLAAPLAAWSFSEHKLEPLIIWLAATVLVAPLGLQYQLLLQKELRLKPIALIDIFSGLLGLLVSVISALNGKGAYSLVFGSLTAACSRAVTLFFIGFRQWPVTAHFELADVKPYLGFGAYQVGERTLNFVAWNLDKMLIGGLLGAHALGIYNVAYQLMQKPLQFLTPIVWRVALPLYSSMSEELARLRSAYLLVIEGVGLLLFPVFVLMVVLAEPIILLLVGPKWLAAVPVFRWLAMLGCLYAIGFPVGSLLLARRRADIAFWLNVWALLLYAVAVYTGSKYGISGVALALLVVQVAGLFSVGFWVRWKVVGMRPLEFISSFMPPLLLAGLSGLTADLIWQLLAQVLGETPLFASAIFTASFMCAIYILLVVLFLRKPVTRVMTLYKNRKAVAEGS